MKRLFIVEDEAIIAMDLAEQLEEFGFDVVGVAYDGESALDALKNLDPDLILMDIVLGSGFDGIETAERILRTRNIPIIFLTAFSDPETVSRAAKTAPYGYITKPYNAQALRASIEIALTKHQLEHKLLYKERWFSNILHAVHDGIIAVGIDGKVHFINSEACRILALVGNDDIVNKPVNECLSLYDDKGNLVRSSPVSEAMQRNIVIPITFGGSIKNSITGERVFIDFTAAPVRSTAHNVIGGVLAIRDASKRISIEQTLRNSEDRFQTAFNSSSVGIALVSFNNHIIDCNSSFTELFGTPEKNKSNIFDNIITSFNDKTKIKDGLLLLLSGQEVNFNYELKLVDSANNRWIVINVTIINDEKYNPTYYFYQIYDLTDRKNAEQKLFHVANYDTLTGLINLNQFKSELDNYVEICEFEKSIIAIITVDIDDYKSINDRFGVAIGDELLLELALRLKDIGHYNQLICRPGGDRFIIALHSLESVNQAMYTTSRILEEFREPFFIDGHEINLTAGAGISIFPNDGVGADILISASDEALHISKSNGSNQACFFNKVVSEQIKQRIHREVRIHHALDSRKLECHINPMIKKSENNAIIQCLCFWPEENKYLDQSSFIDMTEHTRLPESLTQWLLSAICTSLKSRIESKEIEHLLFPVYPSLLKISDATDVFIEQVAAHNISPHHFILEIPEQFLADYAGAAERLQSLKRQGFRTCITHSVGYSTSVAALCRHAPDFYQIICPHDVDENSRRYIKVLVAIAQSLSIPIIIDDACGTEALLLAHDNNNFIFNSSSNAINLLDF